MSTEHFSLSITRDIKATPEQLFRCWTEPALMVQWFCPKPWTVSRAEVDPRAGGNSLIVMRSPDGIEYPNKGVYLEVVPHRKIVFTDAYSSAWQPSAKPFFTGIITFDPIGELTRYTAVCLHWTAADCEAHEKMGFQDGWGKCAEQLAELAPTV
jgi:uncharacterized protein YndB with AHSA1/START domain